MNYFFAANFVLLLGVLFSIRILVIQCGRDRPIIAPCWGRELGKRTKNLFYTDYFYTMGAIYAGLCGVLFLWNCVETWQTWGLFKMPNAFLIEKLLFDRQHFFYFLAAIGLTIALLILPDRTRNLREAQLAFVFFSLAWVSMGLLSIYLSR